MRKTFFLMVMGILFLGTTAHAATLYVDADATSGTNDGSSWTNAYTDLQDALADPSLSSGDEIWVAEGTYYPGTSRSSYFQMKEGVAIYGGFDGTEDDLDDRDIKTNETILSGDIDKDGILNSGNCYHLFFHLADTNLTAAAVLSGFTITGAYANGGGNDDNGAGMFNYESSPTVTRCTFSGNYAADTGGGMVNNYSSPTIEGCTFLENTTGGGGAGGGGMRNNYSDLVVTNTTFSGNSTSGYGGGMYNTNYDVTAPMITNCVFSGNSADRGGAIRSESSNPSITNCTFSGNTASGYGGAIYFANSAPVLTNCILWGDNANEDFGQDEICNANSTITYHYCDIENSYNSSNAWVTYLGTDGGNNIDADPLFVSDPDMDNDDYGDLHLTHLSPCLDTGGASTEDTDMDGEARVFDGNGDQTAVVDMGADEWVDTDQDGFSDYEEENVYGTDPTDTDSDNDGLTDYEEVVIYDTYPDDADTDNDGYNDGAEIIHGSDPADDGSAPAGGLTIHVDADATGSGTGENWANAFTQLQTAITVAVSGDAIWVAEGTYYPTLQPTEIDTTDDRYNHFALKEGVAVYGGFDGTETDLDHRDPAANETILSGDIDKDGTLNSGNCYHVFYHPNGTGLTTDTVLSGFTVTGGYAGGSEPDSYGGGMFNDGSSPTIEGCTFSKNYAGAKAGGMWNVSASAPRLTNCVFTGNETAGSGGALANGDASSPLITNCTFSGNTADQLGGAIVNDSFSNPVLTNCILWGDTAGSDANYDEVYNQNSSTPVFYSCDVEGSGGSDSWTTALGTDNGNNIDSDPLFENDKIHLTGSSPCLDAGNNGSFTTSDTDMDGETRIFNGIIDMGADEFGADTDGDGLSDYTEVNIHGTDPDDADTDGDGLTDYEEIVTYADYHIDPADADTDGDGFDDDVEISFASDPNDASDTPTIYVDADATGSANGTSWTDAYTDLQDAIDAASSGFEIWVAAGTYHPTSQPTEIDTSNVRYNHFALKEGVLVYGGFDGTETALSERAPETNVTILSGDIDGDDTLPLSDAFDYKDDNAYHVFYHPGGTDLTSATMLSGFTITGGFSDGEGLNYDYSDSGGGMFNYGSSPTIEDCTFSSNYAEYGAGMYNYDHSSPTLINCTFNENWGQENGGGMYNRISSSPTLTNCTFYFNRGQENGGGMYNTESSSPTLTNCTFSRNYSMGYNDHDNGQGAGMYNQDDSSPTLTNCSFINNHAYGNGGGMYNNESYPTLTNCTFVRNYADNGGGMYNYQAFSEYDVLALTNCTFSANGTHGGGYGGAIYDYWTDMTLTNCILWGDSAEEGDEIYMPTVMTVLKFTHCNVQGSGGSANWGFSPAWNLGGNIDSDPLFVRDPGVIGGVYYEDLHLTASSPCIDSGSNGTFTTDDTDRDGETRINNGTIDMGADEFVDSDGDGTADVSEPSIVTTPIEGDTSESGTTATFTVYLENRPDGNVVLTVTSSDDDEGTVSPESLTFTSDDWYTAQTVTVTGVDDPVIDGDQTYTVRIDVDDANTEDTTGYTDLAQATVSVINTDNDSAGFTVSAISGNTTEAGGTATFNVTLNSQPTADVTLAVSSSDTAEGTVAPTSLTFTSNNWNAVDHVVTVAGVDDDLIDGDQEYIIVLGEATSVDANYSGLDPADVSVTNTDDETAGFTIGTISGNTTEAGGTATFTVALNSEPTDDVTVAVSSSDTTEGTVSPSTLTFTSANWNAAQTVTVTGVDDDVMDGSQTFTIALAAAVSDDTDYSGLDPADVSTTNTDNETAGFSISTISGNTTEAGGTATFTVALNSEPTDDVTVAVSSSDTTEGTVSPSTLTFTSANWNATGHVITVTGADDHVADGNQDYSVILGAAASTDTNYNGLDPADITVTNTDDETAGFTIGAISGNTTESGDTATFNITLASRPTDDVTIAVSSSDATEGNVSPSTLTFTSANWNATSHVVTMTGVDDDVADGNQDYTIVLGAAASNDANYDGLDPTDVTVTNTDDETAGFTIGAISGMTSEDGGTATFTVVLNSRPEDDVTIPVSLADTTEGSVSPSSLTFTSENWNVVQTVTVTGADDDLPDGAQEYTIELGVATSDDDNYDGLDPTDVTAINMDNDSPAISLSAIRVETSEAGDTAEFFIYLFTQPTADVTITLESNNTAEGTVSPSSVTFTPENWNIARTVTVTGIDDETLDGDQEYTIVIGAATSDDVDYDGLDPVDVTAVNTDDDSPYSGSGGGGGGLCFIGSLGL